VTLFPEALEVDLDAGFENSDLFEYQAFGERLARIVEAHDGPAIVALDGQWGDGKTVFARQWIGLLRHRRNRAIYFDAFRNDYQDDAFLALAREIARSAERCDGVKPQWKARFARSAAAVAWSLVPTAARLSLAAVSNGLLTTEHTEAVLEALQRATHSTLEAKLLGVREEERIVAEFRKTLRELGDLSDLNAPPEKHRQLIIVVDELDRCRPTFALQLLERVEHLFSVDRVRFVLVANLEALAEGVTHRYGLTDGRTYLDKFFQVRVRLLSPEGQHSGRRRRYLRHLFSPAGNGHVAAGVPRRLMSALGELADAHDISLRLLEKIALSVQLVRRSGQLAAISQFPEVLAGLCVMRACEPRLYELARRRRLTLGDVKQFLKLERWSDDASREPSQVGWTVAVGSDSEVESDADAKAMARSLTRSYLRMVTHPRHEVLSQLCSAIEELFQEEVR